MDARRFPRTPPIPSIWWAPFSCSSPPSSLAARSEVVRKKLVCPRSGVVADVDVVRRSEKPERETRVRSCSLFADPRRVECSGDCLKR